MCKKIFTPRAKPLKRKDLQMQGTDSEFVRWMQDRFDEKRAGKSQAALARALGVHRTVVTQILQGKRKRGVTSAERAIIAAFFDAQVAAPSIMSPIVQLGALTVAGIVGDHIWVEDVSRPPIDARRLGTPILTYPLAEQTAYELSSGSADGEWRAKDFIYCVPFGAYRSKLLLDDAVLVRRRQGNLTSYSLMVAVQDGREVVLRPALAGSAPSVDKPDIIGLVIGTYRPRTSRT